MTINGFPDDLFFTNRFLQFVNIYCTFMPPQNPPIAALTYDNTIHVHRYTIFITSDYTEILEYIDKHNYFLELIDLLRSTQEKSHSKIARCNHIVAQRMLQCCCLCHAPPPYHTMGPKLTGACTMPNIDGQKQFHF